MTSRLRVDAETLWSHATSPSGVNAEFWPLLRMTFPLGVTDLSQGWDSGRKLFRSWLLLFGVLPVEYDDLTLVEVEPGRRFLERSRMFSQRVWQHERCLVAVAGGCEVSDRVQFVPFLAALGPIYRTVFRGVFLLRHRNLRRRFGALAL